jgi:transposase
MLEVAMYTTIKTLWELGHNKSEISRITDHDWKTVDKVIKDIKKGICTPHVKERDSILNPYKEKILNLLEEELSAVRIHEELAAAGFAGSYSVVKQHVGELKKREDIFVRIHTAPGEEAQVDFGYVGKTKDNEDKLRKTWVFNMRLSYSRLDYYEKVYNQKVETFILCHIHAFEYFGGLPEVVKIDNLKAAILEANFYEPVYQRMYRDFADYYGFKPLPCRIYHPNDKGKVESGIQYVKGNFFKGRSFEDGRDCDKKLSEWTDKANRRIHGTTRKVPLEVFYSVEKGKLLPLPESPYRLVKVGSRIVYHDCHVFVDYNYYSVPFEYVGKEVEIEISDALLQIYYKGNRIALHPRKEGKGEFVTDPSHYPKYKQYSETQYQEEYETKMAQIGAFALQLFFLILEEQKNYWGKPVKGILSLTKKYPRDIVDMACKRALAYGVYNYHTVRRICENASYVLPVEVTR